ncbi:conserved hypothetical protein [Desulforapulum autotrophicum HRM2]|uniref:Wadjet protein JetD C-terminal domain-containing protein n=1 Tax=Desulforapulum autotrophicum (strain ATCC 43914 / DSM 3382 / VKM B-1955 / HRM2) TaxID=177437 RepID=C0QIL7_DESAH|nr:hypothetical protein [Desulforapulum autotrophicum]ACN17961.1 conserved hypothetical protein [Desulforapulum autotrophicum HRM2]
MDLTTTFFEKLPDKQKIDLSELWDVFEKVVPADMCLNSRKKLSELIDNMVNAHGLELPKSKAQFNRSAQPPLPKFIKRKPKHGSHREKLNPKHSLWHPKLAFLPESRLSSFDNWLKVDGWLKNGGLEKEVVPVNERSYELFGDEKYLDKQFSQTVPFTKGQFSLDDLRCRRIYHPLSWEAGPESARGKPCLVIENMATWFSLKTLNDEQGWYSSVVFGWGAKFEGNWVNLEFIMKKCRFSEVCYFGDIDEKGLMIPFYVKSRFEDQFDMPFNLEPFLYEKLLSLEVTPGPDKSHTGKFDFKKIAPIIPEKIRSTVLDLIQNKKRIPQEALQPLTML